MAEVRIISEPSGSGGPLVFEVSKDRDDRCGQWEVRYTPERLEDGPLNAAEDGRWTIRNTETGQQSATFRDQYGLGDVIGESAASQVIDKLPS